MEAGKFNKFVEIQENQPTSENHGVKKDNWVKVTDVWCSIDNVSAKEISPGKDIQFDKVTIKLWPTAITNANAILHGTDFYEINAVIKMTDHYVLHCTLINE